jgi:hypothetical protein
MKHPQLNIARPELWEASFIHPSVIIMYPFLHPSIRHHYVPTSSSIHPSSLCIHFFIHPFFHPSVIIILGPVGLNVEHENHPRPVGLNAGHELIPSPVGLNAGPPHRAQAAKIGQNP